MENLKERLEEIAKRYVDNSKEIKDMLDEILEQPELKGKPTASYRDQIADIHQWTTLLMKNRKELRERVLWSMIADIHNRTTD